MIGQDGRLVRREHFPYPIFETPRRSPPPHRTPSFPRSAWECRLRRSASSRPSRPRGGDAERPGRHPHAERGNEGNSFHGRQNRQITVEIGEESPFSSPFLPTPPPFDPPLTHLSPASPPTRVRHARRASHGAPGRRPAPEISMATMDPAVRAGGVVGPRREGGDRSAGAPRDSSQRDRPSIARIRCAPRSLRSVAGPSCRADGQAVGWFPLQGCDGMGGMASMGRL